MLQTTAVRKFGRAMMLRNGTGALICRLAGGKLDEQQQRGADQRQYGQAEIGAEKHHWRQQHIGALDDFRPDDRGQHAAGHHQRYGTRSGFRCRDFGGGETQMLRDAETQPGTDRADAVDVEITEPDAEGKDQAAA